MHPDVKQASRIIDSLPQRPHINDEDKERWLNDVWAREPDRIIWHANRLKGWGGSEIGVLVADMRNKEGNEFSQTYHTFKSAHELVKEKLLISSPSRDEDDNENDIRRGTECEPWLIKKLVRDLKETYGDENVKIDHATMNALAGSHSHPEHPWMVGNIDLALIIQNQRLLIDIKAPRTSKAYYMSVSTPFTYDCQLKQYEQVAKSLPVPIEFDNSVLACYDHDQYKFHLGVIDKDEELDNDIIRAGDLYYNEYLLKGRVPDFPQSKVPSATADILPQSIQDNLARAHAIKLAIRSAEQQISNIEDEINAEINSLKLPPNPKISFAGGLGNIKGKAKCVYDDELLSRFAKKYKIYVDPVNGLNDKTRQDIHEQMIKDESVTDNTVMMVTNPEYSFTYPLSRAKKGEIKIQIDRMKDYSDAQIAKMTETMAKQIIAVNQKSEVKGEHAKKVAYSQKKITNKEGKLVVSENTTSPKSIDNEHETNHTPLDEKKDNIISDDEVQNDAYSDEEVFENSYPLI